MSALSVPARVKTAVTFAEVADAQITPEPQLDG
jgi:hypothetical protein